MKYFVVSDIHGHFDEMILALEKAGYDELNDNHILIVNGDLFDRGRQNIEAFRYVYRLNQQQKAIMIKGNHETFFDDIFTPNEHRVVMNMHHNGFNTTLKSFIPNFEAMSINEIKQAINKDYPMLEDWLVNLPYFYETEQYVITHAGLDFRKGDFRLGDFKEAVWTAPEHFFEVDLKAEYNFTKVVIVGHRLAFLIRRHFNPGCKEDHSIYYHPDGQKIGIDGGSYYSKQINVLVIEE